MNPALVVVLIISVGLNVSLVIALLRSPLEAPEQPPQMTECELRGAHNGKVTMDHNGMWMYTCTRCGFETRASEEELDW